MTLSLLQYREPSVVHTFSLKLKIVFSRVKHFNFKNVAELLGNFTVFENHVNERLSSGYCPDFYQKIKRLNPLTGQFCESWYDCH